MVDWIIWYEDGSSFSSDDGKPNEAPREGVQVVAVSDVGIGRLMWHSADYYCWHKEGEWVPHNEAGLQRYLSKEDEPKIYLNGYTIPYRKWADIYNAAVDDPRMPFKKTGRDPRERDEPI